MASLLCCRHAQVSLLILLGSSASGKTEFAKSLFPCPFELKVGSSDLFPSKMVEFKRDTHDAIILADVRDLDFLVQHQEKLQGKYDSRIELATTQGGTCFYTKYLFKVPSVVTINYTTQNLPFLEVNDWLCRALFTDPVHPLDQLDPLDPVNPLDLFGHFSSKLIETINGPIASLLISDVRVAWERLHHL